MEFKRTITTWGLLFASLSCMVGSGWLFGGFYTAQIAGPASIISWILGGILIIFIALNFAELSSMLPLTGGVAKYTLFTHGGLVSFCVSWLAWLSCVAVAPTEVQAICQYATKFFPNLTFVENGVVLLTNLGLFVSLILLWLVSALNIKGIQTLTRYNNFLTIWKIIIPVVTVIAFFSIDFNFNNLTDFGGFMPYGWHGVFASLPGAVVFSFLGFGEATFLAGETKNPRKIPLAIVGSVLICIVLYGLIQLAFIGALSPSMLKNGWHGLHFLNDAGPFAGISLALGLHVLALIIYADAIISPAGTAVIFTASTARLNYAMSENDFAPHSFLNLNQKGVPSRAVWLNFFVGLILFFPFPGWQALIKFQSIAIVLAYAVAPICLVCLRYQAPNIKRPFKVPLFKLSSHITFFVCNLLIYWAGWPTIWRLMVCLFVGLIALFVYRYKNNIKTDLSLHNAKWLCPYLFWILCVSYLGNYSGIGLFNDYFVLPAIAIVSYITLNMASRYRHSDKITQKLMNLP